MRFEHLSYARGSALLAPPTRRARNYFFSMLEFIKVLDFIDARLCGRKLSKAVEFLLFDTFRSLSVGSRRALRVKRGSTAAAKHRLLIALAQQ